MGGRGAGQRGVNGVKGSKGSKGERSIFYTRFYGPHHLCGGKGCGAKGSEGGEGEQRE